MTATPRRREGEARTARSARAPLAAVRPAARWPRRRKDLESTSTTAKATHALSRRLGQGDPVYP